MSLSSVARTLILAPLLALAGNNVAQAQVAAPRTPEPLTHVCDWNYQTRVRVDGQQIDWEKEVDTTFRVDQLLAGEFRLDWTGPNDASFLLWCRQDDKNLYFAIVGRDNFITEPKGSAKGDRMEFWFEIDAPQSREKMVMMEVPIWPAIERGDATVKYGYGRSGDVPNARAALSERHSGKGFFMEVAIPMEALGGNIGFEPLRFTALQRDWDHDGGAEEEVAIATSNLRRGETNSLGHLQFGRFFDRMKQVLEAHSLPNDYRTPMHIWADVYGDARREWIGILGNQLAITGVGHQNFDVASIPITSLDTHQPLEIRALNLDRDEDLEILYRYRVHRASTDDKHTIIQEFAMVLDVTNTGLEVVVHQETSREVRGKGKLTADLELRDRGQYTIVRFRRASGNLGRNDIVAMDTDDINSYSELLLPWEGASKIDYYDYGGGWTRAVD